ncbi:MAG: flagellar protein G [Halobacteriales archaeon]|nr:flagellar protein G [Halobacteriales archaeon]
MAGTSISQLIIFITSMLIVAGVATTLTGQVGQIGGAIDDQAFELSSQIRTDIEIISDGQSDIYNETSNNLTLLVHNTGSNQLATDNGSIDILVNGQFETTSAIEPIDSQTWDPGVVVRIIVDVDLTTGRHRVTVRINSVGDSLRFTV